MPNTRLLSVVILAVSLFTTSAFGARSAPDHHARVTQGKRHKAKHHPHAPKKHAHSRHNHKKGHGGV